MKKRKSLKPRWPAMYFRCGRVGDPRAEVMASVMRSCGWVTADRRAWPVRLRYGETAPKLRFPGRAADDIWLVISGQRRARFEKSRAETKKLPARSLR